jgi:hypothetical protein
MEWLINILEWLIPSGALGSVLVWATSRVARHLRVSKEIHDTYKSMYEDISKTLKELQYENESLRKSVSRLERAVTRISMCKYYHECPVRDELQNDCNVSRLDGRKKRRTNRQREPDDQPDNENDPGAGVESGADAVI